MSRETEPYKRSFSASVGSGLGSLFGGSGKQYFILEHKVGSKYHKMGESQEIIVDNIELGRDSSCVVRFDESFSTVSRRHAAIIKDSNNWKLVQLSATNPTLLNGRKVAEQWYLQNGDEIQLAVGGPKLGFIVPTGNKASVGSIGLSRRMSLFRKQALRPYKQAMTALSIAFLLIVGGLSAWIFSQDKEVKFLISEQRRLEQLRSEDIAMRDSIMDVLQSSLDAGAALQVEIDRINSQPRPPAPAPAPAPVAPGRIQASEQAIAACEPYVYFVSATKIVVTYPNGNVEEEDLEGMSGSGFLLNDGRFVTARHVAEPWFYPVSGGEVIDAFVTLNLIAHNGGSVVMHFRATSSSGDVINFTNQQITRNNRSDRTQILDDGRRIVSAGLNDTDWAHFRTNKTRGLRHDAAMSGRLERGTHLVVLGFPLGITGDGRTVTPQLSSGITTANGLTEGIILTANTSYEQGNSGCPAFYLDASGNLAVIGIISAGAGRSTGIIVPISVIN